MHEQDIYVLTEAGEQQLRGALTTAAPGELELLVRVDGILTVAQIRGGMGASPPADFGTRFSRLVDQGLVKLRQIDPFADQFTFKPSRKAADQAAAEAQEGTRSLQKDGYFVRIARQRGVRDPQRQAPLVAVVVEDDPHLARFLQHYLGFEGFEVRMAGNRAEVVAEFRKVPVPDLVLLDVMLPDVDGFDILSKLRRHPALAEVPVIMLTGKATREAVLDGLTRGADGYVTKPFEADALLEAVRTVLGLPGERLQPPPDPWGLKAR